MTLDEAIKALSKEGLDKGEFAAFVNYLYNTEPGHCALNRWLIELKRLRRQHKEFVRWIQHVY